MYFSLLTLLSFLLHNKALVQALSEHPSSLTRRQSSGSASESGSNLALSPACNLTCTNFGIIDNECNEPHCGCATSYIEAQGNCLVCYATTAEDQAIVQFLLDAEMAQCGREGISVNFALDLPPPAEALVQIYTRQSGELRRNQAVFLGLQIVGGHIGLPIVLTFAVLSRRVRRDPTFLNFCITWIFSSVVFSLLLYRGTKDNTVVNSLGEVQPNICLAQAALTGGAQVMTAASTLSLIIRLWLGFRAAIYGDGCPSPRKSITIVGNAALLVVPYLLFITFALSSVFVGMGRIDVGGTSLQRVIPTNFYCTVVAPNSFIRSVYGITLSFLLITMGFDAHIISILYRHWRVFRHTKTKSAVSPSLLIRVMFFSFYRIVVAVADGTVLRVPPQVGSEGQGESLAVTFGLPVWVDMLQAAIPLIGTLVLGINGDMISTLMFWRRDISIDGLDSGFDADANYIDIPEISDPKEKIRNTP